MEISSVNSDIIRGNVTAIILGSLRTSDRYGYDILKEIETKSDNQYKLKQPTLYNQLKRLEKQGLISSYEGAADDTGGGRRRYYTLTLEGKIYLQKEKSEYEYSRTILNKLVSSEDFDFDNSPAPFDTAELRPYIKREASDEKPKIVYKDKLVEIEKLVEVERLVEVEKLVEVERLVEVEKLVEVERLVEKIVEKNVYFDNFGNSINEEKYFALANQAKLDAEVAESLKLAQANKPSQTLADIFYKLDRESEYNKSVTKNDAYSPLSRIFSSSKTSSGGTTAEIDLTQLSFTTGSTQSPRKSNNYPTDSTTVCNDLTQLSITTESTQYPTRNTQYPTENTQNSTESNHTYCNNDDFCEENPTTNSRFNAYNTNNEASVHSSVSLKDVFSVLDKKEKEINDRIASDELEAELSREKAISEKLASDELEAKLSREKEENERFRIEKEASLAAERQFFDSVTAFPTQKGVYTNNINNFDNQSLSNQNFAERYDKEAFDSRMYAQSELEYKNSSITANAKTEIYATSAVLGKRDDAFEFEKRNVNYRDFFSSIVAPPEVVEVQIKEKRLLTADSELKTRLYSEGFKIRPYDKGNTSEYYTFNFLHSNRINRDCFMVVLAFFLLEIAVLWVSLATQISYKYFLPITIIGSALCAIPTVKHFFNPTKRIRANFNFKMSLLNRGMLFIELTVVCILIGFFALGANIKDINLILASIVIPMICLANIPLSSIIYWLLYRSKKYHIA